MKILAIGAHLDDIELACGGTLALAKKKGHKVHMLVMSGSEYSDSNNKLLRKKSNALKEGRAASTIIGVDHLEILDFPTLDMRYGSKEVKAINRYIDTYKPDIIFTHWPFDTHQDHKFTSLSTFSAARQYNSILLYEPISPSGRSYVPFRPQVYIDITKTIATKLRALKAHTTEYKKYGKEWLNAVNARAVHRGYEMGAKYAESFEVLRYEITL